MPWLGLIVYFVDFSEPIRRKTKVFCSLQVCVPALDAYKVPDLYVVVLYFRLVPVRVVSPPCGLHGNL